MELVEYAGLGLDMALDWVKGHTGSIETPWDEDVNGGISPIHHKGLDSPGDPGYTYLPGATKDHHLQVGPNDYGWGCGWGPLPGK